jgi:hypothetical protein
MCLRINRTLSSHELSESGLRSLHLPIKTPLALSLDRDRPE